MIAGFFDKYWELKYRYVKHLWYIMQYSFVVLQVFFLEIQNFVYMYNSFVSVSVVWGLITYYIYSSPSAQFSSVILKICYSIIYIKCVIVFHTPSESVKRSLCFFKGKLLHCIIP